MLQIFSIRLEASDSVLMIAVLSLSVEVQALSASEGDCKKINVKKVFQRFLSSFYISFRDCTCGTGYS